MLEEKLCYLNGALMPLSQAAISAGDGGLLYGDGLFETIRIYDARPFLLEQHLQRLQESAAFLQIPLPGRQELNSAVEQLIRANFVTEGSLRLTLTGGAGRQVLWPRLTKGEATLLITARETVSYQDDLYQQGCRAVLVSFPRHEASPLVKIKSLNFLENMLGRREAVQRGCDEGLFLNTRGELTEGATSNLFLYDGQTLLTPAYQCGLLPGITRRAVLRLAWETLGMAVKEQVLYRADLEQAEEAFLTASIMELLPLVELEGRKIGTGKPGPVSRALLSEYRRQTRF